MLEALVDNTAELSFPLDPNLRDPPKTLMAPVSTSDDKTEQRQKVSHTL